MQYCTFELDEESHNLCTFVTPFGLYRYTQLPMGILKSSDNATEIMIEILSDIADADYYINDIGCFSTSWDSHLQFLETLLSWLEKAGFAIIPLKCEWTVKETNFLGHWMTPTGIKPWHKKINAILSIQPLPMSNNSIPSWRWSTTTMICGPIIPQFWLPSLP